MPRTRKPGSGEPGAAKPVRESAKPARKVAFPKKGQPPDADALSALLAPALRKRLEAARGFLRKQRDVREDVYFYGPRSGWGLRYLRGERPLCALFVHGARPLAVLSLDAHTAQAVDWHALSEVAQQARRAAHGQDASTLWLDLPLDGLGAQDLKALLKAKLAP